VTVSHPLTYCWGSSAADAESRFLALWPKAIIVVTTPARVQTFA
jgi:hypothetical protein